MFGLKSRGMDEMDHEYEIAATGCGVSLFDKMVISDLAACVLCYAALQLRSSEMLTTPNGLKPLIRLRCY